MANGLVWRANRPNTWLHRPACKREEKPCQLGAVHTWHKADLARRSLFCPLLGRSGHAAITAGVSLGREGPTAGIRSAEIPQRSSLLAFGYEIPSDDTAV